jgi:Outer membrane protein/protective antigen OMA87
MTYGRLALALMLCLAAPSLGAESFTVSSIDIVGAQRVPDAYVRAALPFRPGKVYASVEELERDAASARRRLVGSLGYYDVDVSWSPPEDGPVEITVGLIESIVPPLEIKMQSYTMFDNFPWQGLSSGFAVDSSTQTLAFAPAGLWPFGAMLTTSSNFLANDRYGVSAGAWGLLHPIPEITLSLPLRYMHVFPHGESLGAEELTGALGARIDYSWLERSIGVGIWEEASVECDLLALKWALVDERLGLSARPWRYLSARVGGAMAQYYGEYPEWRSPSLFGSGGLRGANDDGSRSQSGMMLFSSDIRIVDALFINLGILRPSLCPELFFDAGAYEPEPARVDWGEIKMVAGGGLELRLPLPISLTMTVLVGYSIETGAIGVTFSTSSH